MFSSILQLHRRSEKKSQLLFSQAGLRAIPGACYSILYRFVVGEINSITGITLCG
jgi:hypothetical protein